MKAKMTVGSQAEFDASWFKEASDLYHPKPAAAPVAAAAALAAAPAAAAK